MASGDVNNGSPRDRPSAGLEGDNPRDLEEEVGGGQRLTGHNSIREEGEIRVN